MGGIFIGDPRRPHAGTFQGPQQGGGAGIFSSRSSAIPAPPRVSGPSQISGIPQPPAGAGPTMAPPLTSPPSPGGAAPPQVGGPAGGLTNFAQESPDLKFLADQYKQRFSQDNSKRATEQATSSIRDTASGLMKEAETDAARRGVLGQGDSGILTQAKGQIGEAALRDAARASAGIAQGEQGRLDSLVGQGAGILGANAQLGLAQQGLGLKQMEVGQQAQIAQQQAELARMQMAMQQQQQIANLWGTYLGMLK